MRKAIILMSTTCMLMLCHCSSSTRECTFPRKVYIPEYSLLEYRGADTLRFSGRDVELGWDGKHFLLEGNPHPNIIPMVFPDERLREHYGGVPRYQELVDQGKTPNEAYQIYEAELREALNEGYRVFDKALGFTNDMSPEARRRRLEELTEADRENALREAGVAMTRSPLIDSVDPVFEHLGRQQSRIWVKCSGKSPMSMMFTAGRPAPGESREPSYTREKACSFADMIERKFKCSVTQVLVVSGGGLRSISGSRAEEYIESIQSR